MSIAEANVSPDRSARRAARGDAAAKTGTRRLLVDRTARWVVTAGGLAIIASILGILLFILLEVIPLMRPARVREAGSIALPAQVGALISDPYRNLAATLGRDGQLRVMSIADGTTVDEQSLTISTAEGAAAANLVAVKVPPGATAFAAATDDGRVIAQAVDWEITFDADSKRIVHAAFPEPVELTLDPERRPLAAFTSQIEGVGQAVAAAQLADGRVVLAKRETDTNEFSGETTSTDERFEFDVAPVLETLVVDREQRNLFGGTASGEIYWWQLDRGSGTPPRVSSAGSAAITAMTFLIGDRSLVVGQASGAISVWFPVRIAGGDSEDLPLVRIRDLPAHDAAITRLAPSQRNRSFLAIDAKGGMALYYSTSERTLWKGRAPVEPVTALSITPKGDGAVLAGAGRLSSLDIENPHPEISLKALFGKIFYEGYEKPEFA
ncbi:MAG: hypothetical protein R2862_08900 [Thermoanaerobaculia bacterium]